MIARIWNGRTPARLMNEYADFLRRVAAPDYASTKGFRGLKFLKRVSGDEAHFQLITYWDDLDSIRNFAGDDIAIAKYYPEDNAFLLDFPETVEHYEVFDERV